MLAGRASRDETAWLARIELAERLGAKVFTHLKLPAAFPTDHYLHVGAPGIYPGAIDAHRPGEWEVRVTAQRAGDRFTSILRLSVAAP